MKALLVTFACIAAAAAASSKPEGRGGFGIGTHNSHPEILSVHQGHGHGHGGGGGGGHGGGGWGGGGAGGAAAGGGGWDAAAGGHEFFSVHVPSTDPNDDHNGGETYDSSWTNNHGSGLGSVGAVFDSLAKGDYPAIADIVALVLNLLVLAAFGGLVYLLLSPLLGGGGDTYEGWGRSIGASPYYEAFKDNGLLTKVLNSIDYVDTTFAVMKISGDGCRQRIACEMERSAGRNKIFSYSTSWFRNRMRSMDMYKDAVVSGDKQEDCVQKFPNCTYTLVDKIGKWVGN